MRGFFSQNKLTSNKGCIFSVFTKWLLIYNRIYSSLKKNFFYIYFRFYPFLVFLQLPPHRGSYLLIFNGVPIIVEGAIFFGMLMQNRKEDNMIFICYN